MHMDPKLGNVARSSVSWFCEVTRQIKCAISPLAEDLWAPN